MTRTELLHLVVAQARSQGFPFRRWYMTRLELPWESIPAAVAGLARERRYYALLFSHDFAQCFWKSGGEMIVQMDAKTYPRVRPDGSVIEVKRKGYVRKRVREDAWRFHLRTMSLCEEPLRYIRRFVRVEEQIEAEMTLPVRPVFLLDEEDLLPDED